MRLILQDYTALVDRYEQTVQGKGRILTYTVSMVQPCGNYTDVLKETSRGAVLGITQGQECQAV